MKKFSMNDLLNSQSKAEARPENDFVIKQINLDDIVPSPNNKYGIRDIDDLAANIEMMGLQHNIVVKLDEKSGKYELVSGERRYRAIRKLYEEGKTEWKTAPCKITKNNDPILNELELLFANSTARDLTDYEKTYQAGRIKDLLTQLKKSGYKFQGRMREIVAEALKISPAQMGRMESINEKLTPDLKQAFKDEEIKMTAAYELSRLPEEEQIPAYEKFKNGEIKNVKELKKNENKQEKVIEVKEAVIPLEELPEKTKEVAEEMKKAEDITHIKKSKENQEPDKFEVVNKLRKIMNGIEIGREFKREFVKETLQEAIRIIETEE